MLAVASTALHGSIGKGWPNEVITMNKACLIHSAAGGVGSLLIQICKARGYSPIVAVVGRSDKVSHCTELGANLSSTNQRRKIYGRKRRFLQEKPVPSLMQME